MAWEQLKSFPDMLQETKLVGGMSKYKQSIYDAGYAKGIIHGIGIASVAGILIAGSVAIIKKMQQTRKAKVNKETLTDTNPEESIYNF